MPKSVKKSRARKYASKGENTKKLLNGNNNNNNNVAPKKSKKSKKSKTKSTKKGGKLGPVELDEDKLDKNRFYCVKCRALCFSRKPDVKVGATKKGRNMLKGVCKTCGTKVTRFFS